MAAESETLNFNLRAPARRAWAGAVALLLAFALLLATGRANPTFEAPDEAAHFRYAHGIAATGALPLLEGRAEVFASGAHQRHQPPLYYLLQAVVITGTDRSQLEAATQRNPFAVAGQATVNNAHYFIHQLAPLDDTPRAAWLMRLTSMLLALITAAALGLAARWLAGDRLGALALLALVCTPQWLYINASINNDALAGLLGTLAFVWVLRAWRTGRISAASAALFGLLMAAAALTKLNLAVAAPFAFAVLAVAAARRRLPWAHLLRLIVITGALAVLLAGWWYARNWALYGDPLALGAANAIWSRGEPPGTLAAIAFEAEGVWRSLWMVLGNFNTPGPGWLIGVISAATLAAGAAGIVGLRRGRLSGRWLIALAWVGAMVATLALVTRSINVSQGRFLFPMLAAFLPLLLAGLDRLWRGGPALVIGVLAVTALLMPSATLPTAFPLAEAVDGLPAQAQAVDATAAGVSLIGYRLLTPVVAPDGVAAVEVYLSGAGSAELVLFAKVIDPASGVPIASIDTAPGLVSADQFAPGVIYRVRLRLAIDRARITGYDDRPLELAFGWWRGLGGAPYDPALVVPFRASSGAEFTVLRLPGPQLDQ